MFCQLAVNLCLASIYIVLPPIQHTLQFHCDVVQLHTHALFEIRSELVERVDVGVEISNQGLFFAVCAVGDGFGFPGVGGLLGVQCVRLDLACISEENKSNDGMPFIVRMYEKYQR